MALRIFDTRTGLKEQFLPLALPRVGTHACGVTVYDLCHLGHGRGARGLLAAAGGDLRPRVRGAVQIFGGRYIGDTEVGPAVGDLKAVGAQFTGAITSTGTLTMTNCIDGSFVPIPNIVTP